MHAWWPIAVLRQCPDCIALGAALRFFYNVVTRYEHDNPAPFKVFHGYPKLHMSDIVCKTSESAVTFACRALSVPYLVGSACHGSE